MRYASASAPVCVGPYPAQHCFVLSGSGLTAEHPLATLSSAPRHALPLRHLTAVGDTVLSLHDVVVTVNLDYRLDVKAIALHARNVEHNPRRFAAVIMRIREPGTTALIFSSGMMVVTCAKSEDDSRHIGLLTTYR
ncbi:hypothetical protein B0H13DRAFT_1588241 [Mycena leptocephala]|nr:hypothetical protein B0H13DRAFT_1588241 [Mycena leptocephala]